MSTQRRVFLKTWWSPYLGEWRPFHDNYIYAYNSGCTFSGNSVYSPVPPTPTMTASPTQTMTPSVSPTNTPTLTLTPSPSVTTTQTQTLTPTLSPTPSVTSTQTSTPTQTNTPSNSATPQVTTTQTNTPSVTQSETPLITPTVTSTPTTTTTLTHTPSPSVTTTQTQTLTPTLTPSSTQEPICPEQVEIEYVSGPLDVSYSGTYDRIYSYTGGSLNYYFNQLAVKNYNIADSEGNYGIPYGRFDGTYYYSLFAQSIASPSSIIRYLTMKSTSGYIWDVATVPGGFVSGVELTGNIKYPQRGLNVGLDDSTFYVSYPEVCPTATPTITPTITPSNTVTITPTLTPTATTP